MFCIKAADLILEAMCRGGAKRQCLGPIEEQTNFLWEGEN